MLNNRRQQISPAKEVAYIAVTCALLIGAQYIFSFVSGVEIVTVIFVCFAAVFGIRRGIMCALAFTLLRCFVFGFSPTALVLYLVYFPFLATVFGALGKIPSATFERLPLPFVLAVNIVLLLLAVLCATAAGLHLIKVSRLWQVSIEVLLWVLSGVFALLSVAFDVLFGIGRNGAEPRKKKTATALRVILFAVVAALCTALFTLTDDVLTPLMLGYSRLSALAYFYSSFTAMLPQCVCAVASVSALFLPLSALMARAMHLYP